MYLVIYRKYEENHAFVSCLPLAVQSLHPRPLGRPRETSATASRCAHASPDIHYLAFISIFFHALLLHD